MIVVVCEQCNSDDVAVTRSILRDGEGKVKEDELVVQCHECGFVTVMVDKES